MKTEYKAVELDDNTAVLTNDSIIWVYEEGSWIKVGEVVNSEGCDCE